MEFDEDVAEAARMLADEGRLIEAGWNNVLNEIPCDVPEGITSAMRSCFFTGAHYLFFNMIAMLGHDNPNIRDFERLDRIEEELNNLVQTLDARLNHTEGNA